ncbi:PEP-CTERM sorting domain-containing protein [Planctomyces sp. SH-PL62]|uniref:PEP-CTERM sorting domain-containing protein n=1 Tax=Planctomyces sp. SH-PL62 TaxID=1636152 RepID=UPI0012E787C7|nr:PEP-CTERM sorting domain-containing protein [Planctomyces sp. SH-PL62]
MMRSLLGSVAAVVLSAGLGAGAAHADATLISQFNGGVNVNMTYSTGSGTGSETGGAGAFTLTPTGPAGPAFAGFCVSPDVQVGWGPDTIYASSVLELNTVGQSFFTHSSFSDVGNRLAYLLVTHGGGDSTANSALALAIWYTMDQNFSYTGGNTAVNNQYSSFITFAGYDGGTFYGEGLAKLFVIDPVGSYQNMIGLTGQNFVPEPASLVSAAVGMGAMGLFGYRRTRRGAKPPVA